MSNTILEYMKTGITLVNYTNIGQYKNKYVIVHGKVQSIKNNILNLIVDPLDNHDFLINGFHKKISIGDFVAIIGKVASDKSLDFIDMFQLDKEFDLEYVNEIIPLSNHPIVGNFFLKN